MDYLITSGDQADYYLPDSVDLQDSQGHHPANFGRAHQTPLGPHQLSLSHLLPDVYHVLPFSNSTEDLDFIFLRGLCVFQHDYGICSERQHPARVDQRTLTKAQFERRRFTHRYFADQREICRH